MTPERAPFSYIVELRPNLPDLTGFDFSQASMYQSREGQPRFAEQLEHDETIIRSWGVQEMKAGDWVIHKPSSDGAVKRSGVRRTAFDATYVHMGDNMYRKQAFVMASRIDHDFQFVGVDSEKPERAPAGSYLVLNLDKKRRPIIIDGRRDIFFYKESDLLGGYLPIPYAGEQEHLDVLSGQF